MQQDAFFESTENQALLAVCARKTIRTAAIGGMVWGAFNLLIGVLLVRVNPLNAGLVMLGLLMLTAGGAAMRKPSLRSLLTEALVSILLLVWNVAVTMLNATAGQTSHISGHGLIVPAIAAVMFYRQYKRLGHLNEAIAGLDHAMVTEATGLCKDLFKARLNQATDVAQASSKRFRLRLMSDGAFCAERNLRRAFHISRASFATCIPKQDAKRLKLVVRHPLGKVTYNFDKKNSQKIQSWLALAAQPNI